MQPPARLLARKRRLYDPMYAFTARHCTRCQVSGCACRDSICAHVEKQTAGRYPRTGHTLRFIGCRGCVVPPSERETCTLYLCPEAQRAPGFPRETYRRLSEIIGRLEWRLMEFAERP